MIPQVDNNNNYSVTPVTPEDRIAVAKSLDRINRYASESNLLYRIWNAVKSIFGQSDWQLTKKELTFHTKRMGFNNPAAVAEKLMLRRMIRVLEEVSRENPSARILPIL